MFEYSHHDSYPEIDTVDNLFTVCRTCHRIIHENNPDLIPLYVYKPIMTNT